MKTYLDTLARMINPVRCLLGAKGGFAMAAATLAVIAAGALANFPAVVLGNIVDTIIAGSADGVWSMFGLIVACLAGRILLTIVQKYLVERAAVAIQQSVVLDNVTNILSVHVDALQNVRVGETTARLDKRAQGTVRFLKLVFLEGIPQLAIAVPALLLAFGESSIAGGVMAAVLSASVIVTIAQIRSQRGIRIALIDKATGLAGKVAELLGHLDFVRAAGMGERVRKRFVIETEEIRTIEFKHHKWMMVFDGVKSFFEDAGLAIVVASGIWQVSEGEMTAGTILALAMLYRSAALPLQNLHRIVDELHESLLQLDAASHVVDIEHDTALKGTVIPAAHPDAPIVRAEHFSLSRNPVGGVAQPILYDLNFEVRAGEIIGIAGPSGGGKSTLLKAMLGLFGDYEGHLELFGSEVREIDKTRLADLVAYGPQKPYVPQGTVRSNINDGALRSGEHPDETLLASLRRAQFKMGLDKEISERGDNISPGQAQRLSLARVFSKEQSRLIVLDEATSMLDGWTQTKVMDELRAYVVGRALIMVAHRLDTLRWADRIIVLDGGRIVQCGSYSELAQTPGTFRMLLGTEAQPPAQAAE